MNSGIIMEATEQMATLPYDMQPIYQPFTNWVVFFKNKDMM